MSRGSIGPWSTSLDLQSRAIDLDEHHQQLAGAIVAVGLDIRRNQIRVGVTDVEGPGQDAIRALGAGAYIFESEPAVADACSIEHCWSTAPSGMKAGLQVFGNTNCTAGYIGRRLSQTPDTFVVVTAGHCVVKNGAFGVVWDHNNNTIGTELQAKSVWMDEKDADVGLIEFDSGSLPTEYDQLLTKAA